MRSLTRFLTGRWILAVAAILLAGCSSRPAAGESNLQCVERLELPAYPPIAASARVQATVAVTVAIGPNGTPDSIDTSGTLARRSDGTAHVPKETPLFNPAVTRSLQRSKFSPLCATKTVRLAFDFHLSGDVESVRVFVPESLRNRAGPGLRANGAELRRLAEAIAGSRKNPRGTLK